MLTKKIKCLICLLALLIVLPILIDSLDAFAVDVVCEGDWSCPYEMVWNTYPCTDKKCGSAGMPGTCRKCEDPE